VKERILCYREGVIMRALAVRQPYASLIVNGHKIWEMRSRPTNIRGRIGIYSSVHIPTELEKSDYQYILCSLKHKGYSLSDSLPSYIDAPRGCLIGTVEIEDCFPVSVGTQLYSTRYSLVEAQDKEMYALRLQNPVKFEKPIPIKWTSGGSWANINIPEV